MKEKILVSVIVPTYKQSEYLELTLLSIINQKTNFHYEIIISNDASTDNSDSVIQDIIKSKVNNENISIKYFNHEKNLGMIKNWIFCIEQCEGKYIAICEGDDYWIDENKLQKQVDFLEQNTDYSISCHNIFLLNGDILSSESPYDKENTQDTYTLDDLACRNIIPTLSVVYRRSNINFPDWYLSSPMGDYPLMLWIAQKGKIKYFKEKMGVYRQNVGVWSNKQKDYTKIISVFENLLPDFENFPTTKKLLKEHKNKYIKLYLRVLPLKQILKSKYFLALNFIDKTKVILRKLL